jgi:pimeloyl-ACP methyl ester carboxylesterase
LPLSDSRAAFDSRASLAVVADRQVELVSSPLAPGRSPVRLHYRDAGAGPPLLMLHGGWGYEAYPFDRQITKLASSRRIVIPDRTGYGRSGRLPAQATDFHRRAAGETLALIDALALDRPILWGHSDGAVVALLMALDAPERVGGVIAEATHFFRDKPGSRQFFEAMRDAPERLGERITTLLAREHGDDWRHVVEASGDAWLRLAAVGGDLYDGRLSELRVPVLVVHGADDPRTEAGELDALRTALEHSAARSCNAAAVRFAVFAAGGHSPHTAPAIADDVTRTAEEFIASLGPAVPSDCR